ncbi:MAG TPA: DNA gyrase modulator, partial [Gammaproteobacteria bacterium]|nr:DNA gyrase modulator [Gammaproteobacteria bacterium]
MDTASHALSVLDKASSLKAMAQDILHQAKKLGASEVETSVQITSGFDVKVRLGEVDTVSFNRDQQVGIDVFYGKRKGSASTSDLSPESIAAAVTMACEIAQVTQEDPFSGLADPVDMA